MTPFIRITSVAAVLPERDIDTDIIFPARYLLLTSKSGLGQYAFFERRYEDGGRTEKPGFALNQPGLRKAQIIVAGSNFGCGSSREHAVWALADLGVRCVIADSFGDIFYANCFKNGVLPLIVSPSEVKQLSERALAGEALEVDLESLEVRTADGNGVSFEIQTWRREALLNGWDEISMIQKAHDATISAFEVTHQARFPWLNVRTE